MLLQATIVTSIFLLQNALLNKIVLPLFRQEPSRFLNQTLSRNNIKAFVIALQPTHPTYVPSIHLLFLFIDFSNFELSDLANINVWLDVFIAQLSTFLYTTYHKAFHERLAPILFDRSRIWIPLFLHFFLGDA